MNFLKITKQFAALAIAGALFTSCDKPDRADPIGDRGQTIIKITGGGDAVNVGDHNIAIDFVSTPTTLVVAEIVRDVPSNEELMKPMTVTIKEDTLLVDTLGYNRLPQSWYQLVTTDGVSKVGGEGGTYTVTFAPGEFAKQIKIIIPDATVLDPSQAYGLGFNIIGASQGRVTANNLRVTNIGAKNMYDGVYSYVSGLVTRYTAPGVPQGDALSGPLGPVNPDVELVTTGANQVAVTGPAGPVGITWSGGTSGVAGIDGLRLTVDPLTNLVTVTSSGNTTLTNWAGKPNYYDPTTKTFYLAFRWNPTSTTREYEVVLKYKGPR